jgi:hypothetical protein
MAITHSRNGRRRARAAVGDGVERSVRDALELVPSVDIESVGSAREAFAVFPATCDGRSSS